MEQKYKASTNKNLISNNNYSKQMEIAEQIKRALSAKESHSEVLEGEAGPKKIEILRSEFEQSIQTHIEKLKMLMEEALDGRIEARKC